MRIYAIFWNYNAKNKAAQANPQERLFSISFFSYKKSKKMGLVQNAQVKIYFTQILQSLNINFTKPIYILTVKSQRKSEKQICKLSSLAFYRSIKIKTAKMLSVFIFTSLRCKLDINCCFFAK